MHTEGLTRPSGVPLPGNLAARQNRIASSTTVYKYQKIAERVISLLWIVHIIHHNSSLVEGKQSNLFSVRMNTVS